MAFHYDVLYSLYSVFIYKINLYMRLNTSFKAHFWRIHFLKLKKMVPKSSSSNSYQKFFSGIDPFIVLE